jgi:hypothetical protein
LAEYKACIQCGTSFELTPTYWHKSKDGFHARCRRCRNAHEKKARKKKTNKKLAEIEKGAVDLFVASARLGGANIPHSSELLEVLMEYFGGVRGFSNVYLKQFFDAPAGGAFRTKMLDTVVRLVSANTAMGGAKKPLTAWTEEELEDELKQRILEAATTITIQGIPLKEMQHGVSNVPVVATDAWPVRPLQEVPARPDGEVGRHTAGDAGD